MRELAILDRKDLSWEDRTALLAFEVSQLACAITNPDDFSVHHMFRDEWYIREFSLPAGTIFVGRKHKQGHIVKLLKGKALMATEAGKVEYTAPAVIHTKPGFITICIMLTDITAQSWHFNPDRCMDITELEEEHFGSPIAMLERGKQLWLAQSQLQ